MSQKITYPLRLALELSPIGEATYTGPEGHLIVYTLEGWLITGELHSYGTICEESEEREWCEGYLTSWNIPLHNGWLPEPLRFLDEP